jgi:hypothetical protein
MLSHPLKKLIFICETFFGLDLYTGEEIKRKKVSQIALILPEMF